MAINTLVTLRDAIQDFVDGHGQLQRVVFEADDHRSAYITEGKTFPMMFVAPIDVVEGSAVSTHRLKVYVYERINHDRLDVWENANDTSLIFRDLIVWFNSYSDGDINIIEDPSAEFGSDRELDNLVGYFGDVQFETPSHGRCDVPINVTPIPPPICASGVVNVNKSDGELISSVTVASGEIEPYNVANSPIDIGGNVFSLQATESLNLGLIDTDNNTPTTSIVGSNIVFSDDTYNVNVDGVLVQTFDAPAFEDLTINLNI